MTKSRRIFTAQLCLLALLFALLGALPASALGECDPEIDYLKLGNTQYAAGSYQDAVDSFTCALVKHPNSAAAYNGRGNARRNTGDYPNAIVDYTRAIALAPNFATAYNNRGWAYYQTQNLDQALADFDKAIELDPDLAYAYNNRGLVYQLQGKRDQAVVEFQRAISLGHDPLSWPQYNLEQVLLEQEKLRAAALTTTTTTTTTTTDLSAAELFDRALNYANAGSSDLAIEDYTAVIRLEPNNQTAYYNRGDLLFQQGLYELAIDDFSKVIELDPQNINAIHYKGVAYERLGRYADSLREYNRVLEINPTFLISLFGRGNAYNYMGNYQSAVETFTEVLALNENYSPAYRNRGLAYQSLGEDQRAVDDFTQAMLLNPDYNFLVYDRAISYLTLGNYPAALADYSAAIDLGQAVDSSYLGRGIAHVNLGDRAAGGEDFLQWLRLNQVSAYDNLPIADGDSIIITMSAGAVFNIPFEGSAGQSVTFNATSVRADPLLVLLGPDGKVISSDDDDGGGGNARIENVVLPVSGKYTLILGHAGGGDEGEIVLTFGEAQGEPISATVLNDLIRRADDYRLNQQYALAIEDYTTALQIDSANPRLYFNRGFSYGELDEYALALADYTSAIEYGYSPLSWAYYNRGWANRNLGNYEEALVNYNRALELDPNYALAYYGRGYNYELMGEYEKALEDYSKSLDLDYSNPASVYYDRGSVYLDLMRYEEALADFNMAVELGYTNFGLYLARGIAYAALDQRTAAGEDFLIWLSSVETSTIEHRPLTLGETLILEMTNGRVHYIPFEGEKGQKITLSAVSADVDTLIVVLDKEQYVAVTGDDDDGERDNALIEGFEVPENGTYIIIVGHAGGGREGLVEFTVSVAE